MRAVLYLAFVLFIPVACTGPRPVAPETARQQLQRAWDSNQHVVWEIDWPNAPTGGPVTIEVWQASDRYRYEILETPAPALLGETLVADGTQTWRFNRLRSSLPPKISAPALAPITDVVASVSNLLSRSPTGATTQADTVNFLPATKILMVYPAGDWLAMWIDARATGLPLRVEFSVGKQRGQLTARFSEPLTNPPPALFTAGDWDQ